MNTWIILLFCTGLLVLAGFVFYQFLKLRIQNLAQEALRGNSEQFLQLAKTILEKEQLGTKSEIDKGRMQLDQLIAPLRETLLSYQKEVKEIEHSRTRAFTNIETELKRVAEMGHTLNRETSALKNALKRPHVRGRWGEVQLKNCIELSGMSEYCDVTFQNRQESEDGTLIPDLTVKMPGGRMVIVDAKTPIDAFLSSLEASDDTVRAQELARLGRHVKDHTKKLAGKSYAENFRDSADFIVMFLPNESFLYAALESEPDLIEYALEKKVLIATPPTFIGLLKVIRFGWNEEKLAENARRISNVGMELHKRVCDFVESFVAMGKQIDRAKSEFDKGLSRLERRILPEARKLEQLGAKSAKNIPDVSEFTASPQSLLEGVSETEV